MISALDAATILR